MPANTNEVRTGGTCSHNVQNQLAHPVTSVTPSASPLWPSCYHRLIFCYQVSQNNLLLLRSANYLALGGGEGGVEEVAPGKISNAYNCGRTAQSKSSTYRFIDLPQPVI